MKVELSQSRSSHSLRNKVGRVVWGAVWLGLYRSSPRPLHFWRRSLLRVFGAKIGAGARPSASARVWAPWNLEMGEFSRLGADVDCYSVDKIRIGAHAIVSQYSYLCTASHDPSDPHFGLTTAPITIEDGAWVAADVFVGPGVTVGEGSVVGARSSIFKSLEPWVIAVGNPARVLKKRELRTS